MSTEIAVSFHFGAEDTSFDASQTTVFSSVKDKALENLHIVPDPNIEYIASYEGHDVTNEAQTLGQVVGTPPPKKAEFHLRKRPKGG